MKILGEDLSGKGRWYIALPPLLLVGFLVGLFFLATEGQSRLEAANERVHDSQMRQQALSEFIALLTTAETAQRGYILTGEASYLEPYNVAVPKIEPALRHLHSAYGAEGDSIGELRRLTERKLDELVGTLALFKLRGASEALSIIRTDVGKRTMDDIVVVVEKLRLRETQELSAATEGWRSDLLWSRWFTAAGAILNIGLVLWSMRLVYNDMRRRARLATDLRDQKQELERQVDERTHELTELSTHLQGVAEQEKSALSRELHDELGGLLVAARMDISWLQQRLPTSNPAIEQRFKRIHESLSAGVDLKRRVVEELRPTLLDNMGLFTALRWQFKETCRRSGLTCTESIPEIEPAFHPDAAIGVFRIAQESLTNILKHANAKSADLSVEIGGEQFILRISDDGRGIGADRPLTAASHGLAAMRHRVSALGGTWRIFSPDSGGTVVIAVFPLSRLLLSEPA